MTEPTHETVKKFPATDRVATILKLGELGIPNFLVAEACDTTEASVKNWRNANREPRTIRSRRALDNICLMIEILELRGVSGEELETQIDFGIQNALEEKRTVHASSSVTLSPIANADGLELMMGAIDKIFPTN